MKQPHPNQQLLVTMKDEAFWTSLHPHLHISDRPLLGMARPPSIDPSLHHRLVSFFLSEGYFDAPAVIPRELATRLAVVVRDLAVRGIPEVFAFVYDEFWQIFARMGHLFGSLLGHGYKLTPSEVWIFHVPRGAKSAGWAPHRDITSHDTIRTDNTPTAMTVWIPLTDATPLNGCMYMLPEKLDDGIAVLKHPQPSIALLQNVRAVPAPAGSVLGWNTRILHWGGRSSDAAEQPRISAAVYFQARDYDMNELFRKTGGRVRHEAPLAFDRSMLLPFEARLRAIGEALRIYGARSSFDFTALADALPA